MINQTILDQIRKQFELFGFSSLETRALEPLQYLLAKGSTDKEIYTVGRLHEDPKQGKGGQKKLSLEDLIAKKKAKKKEMQDKFRQIKQSFCTQSRP